ncbi:cytoskeleton-associated protein 2-like isoform X2 [Gadus macrocephalus]|uniref:cytoskeleton-associated protein 2-like isoform X2 n=1 Tax=Gadus macrocephalus TaxID=80720 RepID=UPI0028CBB258|nr:cytoskeleton-associated protein 2-like isoform X2 [Gadus macrocephalus]
MDEAGPDSKLCRKELRKQKLMEYLAAKGKLNPPNPKPYLRNDYPGKKAIVSALEPANGKENQRATTVMKHEVTYTVKQVAKHGVQPTVKAQVKQSFTRGGILSASQRVNGLSVPTVQTRPPAIKEKPLVTRTYTIAALKARAGNNQLPKQSETLVKSTIHLSTVKSSASSAQQTITHPHRTSHAKSGSIATHYVVETKIGTLPVGPCPRNVKSNPTQGRSAITTTTTASNVTRVRSTSAPSAPKANLSTAIHKPFQCGATVSRAASLISHDRPASRGHAKPVSTKPLQPARPSAAGKQTLLSTRATAATGRLILTHRVGKTTGALQGTPARRTADERPDAKVAGHARQAAFGTGTSAGTKSQRGGGSAGGPGNHLGAKGRVLEGNEADTATIPARRTTTSSPPVIPQTLPRSGTRVPKTPGLQGSRAPQTEGKKSTAAQEERMIKLQEWRDTKGISYKRPPMPVRPQSRRTLALALPQPYWATMEEDEAHSLISAVDRSLDDCIKLLTEGCSPEHVTKVLSRLPPLAKKFAKYWICQARIMERQGNLDVLPMFEEAVRLVLEPVDDLRTVVFDILKKQDESERAKERVEEEEDQEEIQREASSLGPDAVGTPQPVRALIQGERGYSSAVKYKITATPGGGQSQQRGRFRVDGQEVRFFTPVRRSVRIERACLGYPAYLREQDPCVASYDDLLAEDEPEGSGERQEASGGASHQCTATPVYVYRENEALQDQVKVQLVYDDDE